MSPLNLGSQGQECAGRDEYVRRFQDMDTDASKSIDFDEMLAYYQPWLKPAAAGPGPVGAERGIRSLLENQREKLHAEPPQEGPAGADAYTSPQLAVPPAGSAGFAGAANAGRGPCPSATTRFAPIFRILRQNTAAPTIPVSVRVFFCES